MGRVLSRPRKGWACSRPLPSHRCPSPIHFRRQRRACSSLSTVPRRHWSNRDERQTTRDAPSRIAPARPSCASHSDSALHHVGAANSRHSARKEFNPHERVLDALPLVGNGITAKPENRHQAASNRAILFSLTDAVKW